MFRKKKIIVLSGIGTRNKGAELMLYAILQEVERKFPKSLVYLPNNEYTVNRPISYIQTSLTLKRKRNYVFKIVLRKLLIIQLLNCLYYFFRNHGVYRVAKYLYLNPRMFDDRYVVPGADYFIDASGYHFSDQFNLSERIIQEWQALEEYSSHHCKIVFLPQAFGPQRKTTTIRAFAPVNKFANLIYAREKQSYNYLKEAGYTLEKIRLATDFTSLVEGKMPKQYEHLRGAVCIIPNIQMVNHNLFTLDNYVNYLSEITYTIISCGRKVYFLNHEGPDDAMIIRLCKERLGSSIAIVDGLNALETKGLIASSYLCISSRYHGVASALSSVVPCLATSWSHKYSSLFADYGIEGCILPIEDKEESLQMIQDYLQESKHAELKAHLIEKVPIIKSQNRKMWDQIWNL